MLFYEEYVKRKSVRKGKYILPMNILTVLLSNQECSRISPSKKKDELLDSNNSSIVTKNVPLDVPVCNRMSTTRILLPALDIANVVH